MGGDGQSCDETCNGLGQTLEVKVAFVSKNDELTTNSSVTGVSFYIAQYNYNFQNYNAKTYSTLWPKPNLTSFLQYTGSAAIQELLVAAGCTAEDANVRTQ